MTIFSRLALFLSVLLLSGCDVAVFQNMMDNEKMADEKTVEENMMAGENRVAGFAMEGGKMRIIGKDGEDEIVMTNDVQLKSGMKVMMDGTVMMVDGKTMILKEGGAVMMDGTVKTVEDLELKMEEKAVMKKDEGAMMKKEDSKEGTAMVSTGEYKDHTASNLPASILSDGTVKVLYFFASWCPSCKKANQTLTAWYADGTGLLTVYKINYDEEKALEQKYGVTYQHTFVKIDGQGNMIEKIQGPTDQQLRDLLQS